ncbi:hypothetical protein TNCV_3909911 [Trichonephila clavipes]|nr:hypothetical protein TNCV_3909911 [Trichonephila clavipes]
MSRLKCPPVRVEWMLGERVSGSGVIHVTLPWFKIARYIPKSPHVAEEGDVNILSFAELNSYPLHGSL